MSRPARRGRALATLGLVLACGAALGCSGDDDTAGGTTTSVVTTTAPSTTALSGPPPGATEQGLRELGTGDCFDVIEDPTAQDRAVWLIDCADPHSHEVYDVLEYDGEGSGGGMPYPGAPVVQNWAEDACHGGFEAFVGEEWILSDLEIQVWWPSERSWDAGDRSAICTVFSPAGDPLTGTQRGAAR